MLKQIQPNKRGLSVTPDQFISTWKQSDLNERQGAHIHFSNLCEMLGVPKPTGTSLMDQGYGFEINVDKTGGGGGYADAWKRNCFAWEYKSPGKNLSEALKQLRLYTSDLENPPLLIVSDMRRIELHTNWTSMVQETHVLELEDLADARLRQKLAWAFDEVNVEQLKPRRSANATTEEVARKFVAIAQNLRDRGHDPELVAHFVNRMVFCMFAEDVDLLPNREFERMLVQSLADPDYFQGRAESLFKAMAKKHGLHGNQRIEWFNGGLFENNTALPLTADDIRIALDAARQNWSEINPSIMGTLFERGLDPSKRSQLGAHYTDAEKIMMIVKPVIVEPLLREWAVVRAEIEPRMAAARKLKQPAESKKFQEAQALRIGFIERLKTFRVLDPACGSGNFLYLALKALKDIEFRVNFEAEELGLPPAFPAVGPECVKGIEINSFAAELARVSVWIGEIQWMREKNFGVSKDPILKPLETIECRDALLNPDGTEAEWPEADVIIGNPPFLGAKLMKSRMRDARDDAIEITDLIRATFKDRLPGFTDLVCYWFEKARALIEKQLVVRAGLVATNSIRKNTNLPVLKRITATTSIYCAWSEMQWAVDGANVDVSIICFGDRGGVPITLDGVAARIINPDLTTGLNLTSTANLSENEHGAYLGIQKSGPFDVSGSVARAWIAQPTNPNGRGNDAVLKPYWNGDDLTDRPRDIWLIDLPLGLSLAEAALFEKPFQHISTAKDRDGKTILELRADLGERAGPRWWEPHWPRPDMRSRIQSLKRYIVTAETAQYRIFVWLSYPVLPDKNLIVIPRDDDTTFGILHSAHHRLWSARKGSDLENRPRYTHTSTFATFPFPEGLTPNIPAADYANDSRAIAIATAAARLNGLREAWLNPPDLVQRVPEVVPGYPDRILPVDEKAAAILKTRTLTKLYNERPAWLDHAHKDLDAAVASAYGWPLDLTDDQILERLFALNQERAAKQ